MPETLIVRSAWGNRPVEVPGLPTPVDGLWVARHPKGCYMIIHKRSERVIGSEYADPETALACVMELGPLAGWGTCEHPVMELPTAEIERIDAIVKRWGGGGIQIGPRKDAAR